MKKIDSNVLLSLLFLILLAVPGCTVHVVKHRRPVYAYVETEPAYVQVEVAPPPVRVEERQEAQPHDPDAVWISGYWNWQNRWVWVSGHWEVPRAGFVWQPPVAIRLEGGRYRYHRGYWRKRNRKPGRAYTEPNRVVIHSRKPNHHRNNQHHQNRNPQNNTSPNYQVPPRNHGSNPNGTSSGTRTPARVTATNPTRTNPPTSSQPSYTAPPPSRTPATRTPATRKPATRKPSTPPPSSSGNSFQRAPSSRPPATRKPATRKPATRKPSSSSNSTNPGRGNSSVSNNTNQEGDDTYIVIERQRQEHLERKFETEADRTAPSKTPTNNAFTKKPLSKKPPTKKPLNKAPANQLTLSRTPATKIPMSKKPAGNQLTKTPVKTPFSCRLNEKERKAGSYLTIFGEGFKKPEVYIRATRTKITGFNSKKIQVFVPKGVKSGNVTLVDKSGKLICGALTIL